MQGSVVSYYSKPDFFPLSCVLAASTHLSRFSSWPCCVLLLPLSTCPLSCAVAAITTRCTCCRIVVDHDPDKDFMLQAAAGDQEFKQQHCARVTARVNGSAMSKSKWQCNNKSSSSNDSAVSKSQWVTVHNMPRERCRCTEEVTVMITVPVMLRKRCSGT